MPDLDSTLKDFISKTAKSKVAVIIPLYGYWNNVADNPLGLQTLKLTMDRVTSSTHNLYVFFVGETSRVPKDIQNFILAYMQAGNAQGVDVPVGASYVEYVYAGLAAAHSSTDAAYFVNLNPWNLIQRVGIDVMVDRLNYSDAVKVVSGYDISKLTDPTKFNPEEFEKMFVALPKESRELNSNFFGITRYALEMLSTDANIRTSPYMERDIWQEMYAKSFEVISSQRLPMFVFDVEIEAIQKREDFEADKLYFQKKYGFIPQV